MAINSRHIDLEKYSSTMLEPGVIENWIKPGVHLDMEDMIAIKKINQSLADGLPYVVLVTSGQFSSISNEARILSASREFAEGTVAKALLIKSMGHRLVGKFYLTVNRPVLPTQLFSDRESALSWLRKKLELHGRKKHDTTIR